MEKKFQIRNKGIENQISNLKTKKNGKIRGKQKKN
jgi:hypothetical protein